MKAKNTINLKDVRIQDIAKVGGKNASLGEMLSGLGDSGVKVPGGYAVTVDAYKAFIGHNDLQDGIKSEIDQINFEDLTTLQMAGNNIRNLILTGVFPEKMKKEILASYYGLTDYENTNLDVAVRSSATAEDLPDASFAGQQETFLNVRGAMQLLDSIKKCFASLYNNRAISYRASRGIDQTAVYLSVCVQRMVRSDVGESGVAFSIDTESGFKDAVVINGTFGLGELLVQGAISPDEFIVYKPKLKQGYHAIIEKSLGSKEKMLMYSNDQGEMVKMFDTPKVMRNHFCLTDHDILKLASWVVKIEEYYTEKHGKWTPVDVEWAVDGNTHELFIVQARPETIHSQKIENDIIQYRINGSDISNRELISGIAVGDRIGSGAVKIMRAEDVQNGAHDFKKGDVLVTDMTDPDWEPIMKIASAIITNKGGRTCHAAIVARELGVPAIVGTKDGTSKVNEHDEVTVCCAQGSVGKVYQGEIPFEVVTTKVADLPQTCTKLMLNVASPDMAFNFAHLPHAGVGLAREEFIINNYIKAHPLALLNHSKLGDEELTQSIKELIVGYENEQEFFVQKLAQGIAKIAASFYPEDVIVRFSDFKSNEYANLLGGKYFEPKEENPMIGWRGASRYYSQEYKPAFQLECEAIRTVRDEMGLDNVIVMIPFCRTIGEFKKVLDVMKEFGLVRGENGLQVYLMAEVPSNVILAHQFSKLVDGFSIGSNDLTQLVLGLDRDSHLVSHLYDERNEAVKFLIERLIKVAHCYGVKVGICGQAPSDFPDFASFLVEKGIDSISVTPDSILKTLTAIAKIEEKMPLKRSMRVA
jgi:pyruvate,water dikinase